MTSRARSTRLKPGRMNSWFEPLRPRALRARVQASLRYKAMIDSLDDSETILFSLAQSVEERDPDLGQHCQRLALMAAAMGVTLSLPGHDILALQRGGYLHDIGKVAIPDHVLFKAGPLTPEEWDIMKTHAERGERICSSMRSLSPVLPIIRHHHERWNGTGYPDGLSGRADSLARAHSSISRHLRCFNHGAPLQAGVQLGRSDANPERRGRERLA